MTNTVKINIYSCDHCKYQVASSKIMDIHKSNFHDKDKKYDFDLCGHQVSHKYSSARHKKIVRDEIRFPGRHATTKQQQRSICLNTEGWYMKESNTLVGNATIKQNQMEILLNTKGQYMKQSNILAGKTTVKQEQKRVLLNPKGHT